jgi:hypothetical protein
MKSTVLNRERTQSGLFDTRDETSDPTRIGNFLISRRTIKNPMKTYPEGMGIVSRQG